MRELLKTTDPVLISAATAFLKAEDIDALVFDVHMSVLEGSIGILPRRLMVHPDDEAEARRVLALAGIELPPQG